MHDSAAPPNKPRLPLTASADRGLEIDEQRRLLILLLRGTEAHMGFDDAVADFPAWAMNQRAPNVSYTPWHIAEHIRITQWDILRYIEDPTGHVSPD